MTKQCHVRSYQGVARWINKTQADVGSSSNFNVITAIDSVTVAKEGILGEFTTEKAARRYEQDGQYGPKAGFEECGWI